MSDDTINRAAPSAAPGEAVITASEAATLYGVLSLIHYRYKSRLPDDHMRELVREAMEVAHRAEQACKVRPAAPAPVRVSEAEQEAAWFRWLRDNPQAAAYTAALVARTRPHGPDLAATMNSGEVVGVMEDAKQPEYRYTMLPSPRPVVTEAMVADAGACYAMLSWLHYSPGDSNLPSAWRHHIAEATEAARRLQEALGRIAGVEVPITAPVTAALAAQEGSRG